MDDNWYSRDLQETAEYHRLLAEAAWQRHMELASRSGWFWSRKRRQADFHATFQDAAKHRRMEAAARSALNKRPYTVTPAELAELRK